MPRVNYRKIYEDHHGPIPKDNDGRTYEIHHIDGNRKNNHIENLVALSIQDHYDIHFSQGDWGACMLIARSMKISPEEKSRLAKLAVQKQLDDGTHNFIGGEITRRMNAKMIEDGTHKFLDSDWQYSKFEKQIEDGTHNFIGGEIQRLRVQNGTHNLLNSTYAKEQLENGTHNFQGPNSPAKKEWVCSDCGKSGKGVSNENMHKNKFCKMKKDK